MPIPLVDYCGDTAILVANDGEPKFDLARFNQEYFDRLRSRVRAAGQRGIYASLMLFEGWEIQFTDAWRNHPFHGPNNVNGVEGDLNGALAKHNEALKLRSDMNEQGLVAESRMAIGETLVELGDGSHRGRAEAAAG